MSNLNGHYLVDGDIIENKIYAIIKASESKKSLTWNYYDSVFSNAASKFTLTDIPLTALYTARAQQLRDSYDYLILNYSGGSDSHNILHTFLQNNIKLDHIYVQWPERLMDKGIYTPNSMDKSNANFHSEWDLVLKKDLEWIGANYPDIKIEIADWSLTLSTSFYTDDLFANNVSNLPSIARSQKQNTFSDTESRLAQSGKRVGSIFGVDKPMITKKANNWYFYFADTACMTQANPENPYGTEYFYWSPNFPDIAVAQAHKMKDWFIKNPDKQYLIQAKSELLLLYPTCTTWSADKVYSMFSEVQEISKKVCYPYWNFNRFQADKPFAVLTGFAPGTRAWDNILTVLPDFNRVQEAWRYHWKSYLTKIDSKYMRSDDLLGVCTARWHQLSV